MNLNRLPQVKVFNLAVWEERGEKTFYYSPDAYSAGGFFKGPNASSNQQSVSVKTCTLNDVFTSNCIQECDLLKLDCEGSEYGILFSAPAAILRRIKNMVMEIHNLDRESNQETMSHYLETKGFSVETNKNILLARRK